jgi:glycosyltransferase involved in cell wall biosynthesis
MHILHILPHLAGGGAERQMFYLSQELVQLGHHVDIAYLYEGKKELSPQFIENANYFQIKANSNYDYSILLQLIRLIKSRKPDIVHTWIRQMDIIGGLAAIYTKTKWLLREPNSSKAYPTNWKHLLRLCLARFARIIVANSQNGLMYWKNSYPRKNLCVIPNGVPFQSINSPSANMIDHNKTNIDNFILYAGRLEKQKKIDILIRAISLLNKKQHINLVICGDGNQKKTLETLIKDLGLETKILMTGPVSPEHVWYLMKGAKAFVLLSEYEGFPNVLLEAIVCQCPLIVSNIPAHKSILNENNTLWADPITPECVAKRIFDVLTNQADAKKRTINARQRIEKWSVQNMAKKYEKIYQWMIQNN